MEKLDLLFAVCYFLSILCIGHIGKITKSSKKKKHLKAVTTFTFSSA